MRGQSGEMLRLDAANKQCQMRLEASLGDSVAVAADDSSDSEGPMSDCSNLPLTQNDPGKLLVAKEK